MVKYSEIRTRLKIEADRVVTDNSIAYLTHYFQNHKNGVSRHYKTPALNYLSLIKEDVYFVKEPQLQQYLPIKFDVPFPPRSIMISLLSTYLPVSAALEFLCKS